MWRIYNVGDIAYIIESNRFIREGKIVSAYGGMYTFRFVEGGAIKIRENRLFRTEESAQQELDERKRNRGSV